MKHIVDIEKWERRDNYKFFSYHANSWYSVTTEIDCTGAFNRSKASGRSLFLNYLFAVLSAANEVKELRYRIDKDGQVVFYDNVDIITPIEVPGKTFFTVLIPFHKDFDDFYRTAYEIITNIPEDGDPYGTERELVANGDYNVVHLSAVPKMYFTSITYTQYEVGNGCTHPLMSAGKIVNRDGRMMMPLSIYVNHAFVDGAHLSQFFEKIEEILK